MKWLAGLLLFLAIALAFHSGSDTALAFLEVGGKLALLAAAIHEAIKRGRERRESGLSKDAFQLAKAGGPEKLLQQAKHVRLAFYGLCALPAVTFIYCGFTGDMAVAFQMLLITTLIALPFAGLLHWNQQGMTRVANQELGRLERRGHRIDPYQ